MNQPTRMSLSRVQPPNHQYSLLPFLLITEVRDCQHGYLYPGKALTEDLFLDYVAILLVFRLPLNLLYSFDEVAQHGIGIRDGIREPDLVLVVLEGIFERHLIPQPPTRSQLGHSYV